jgi:lipopolysaccharide assembly outer membrane protein LptD (OstA)
MRRLGLIVGLILSVLAVGKTSRAQQKTGTFWSIESLSQTGEGVLWSNNVGVATNGVKIVYGDAILTADQVTVFTTNFQLFEAVADGKVRIQQGAQLWAGEHIRYNFVTRQMEAAQFRTGQPPFFASGDGLHVDTTNHVYVATNSLLTSEDLANPTFKIRAHRIKIIPGDKIQAYSATLYAGDVPVFYFPFYSRNIGPRANNFNFTPGYRSLFGPFILANYTWFLNDQLDGVMHLDYRQKRGPGVGPDINYHLGPWGEGTFSYYYTHDDEPNTDQIGVPIPEDRQRVYFSYQANPATNLYLKAMARYESDIAVVRDFFEGEYRRNPQPDSFFEANKFWQNWSVDAFVQPRLNDFLQTVERLPDIKLTGYRQELGSSPLFYESESSFGYYRFRYAENTGRLGPPPGLDYEAARADTYHQVLLPETFFGWLNVTPRVGGRFTYYGEASGPGATTDEQFRGVFNTGAEVSYKASRVWPGLQNDSLEVSGLRHIIQPSANYVFVPTPTVAPKQLPQFDYELPSLRLLPLDFPDYNAIDSIDSQNVIRWGLANKLQTKRDGQIVNLVNWSLYTDWRLKPRSDQTTFADLYSDLTFRPRSWLSLESLTRYDINGGQLRMAYHTLTIQPNSIWSWRAGHYFLRDDLSPSPTALGPGNSVLSSTIHFRLNENWGLRASHYFDVTTSDFHEQAYTVYRDMRSWTAALSFLVRKNPVGPQDYTVAFTFSLKAFPHFGLGADAQGPYSLLGG